MRTRSWTRRFRAHRSWGRAALAVGAAMAMTVAGVVVPVSAAPAPVSQSWAQAVHISLASAIDVSASASGTTASNDGTGSDSPKTVQPAQSLLPDNGFLAAGALAEVAQAGKNGSSFACAGIGSPGAAIEVGSGATPCTFTGSGTSGVELDLAKVPGVGGLLSAIASLTLTADAITAHAAHDGATASGQGSIVGLKAQVKLVGGLLNLTVPVTVPAGKNVNVLTAVVDALTAQGNPLLSGLIDALSGTISGVLDLKANYQLSSPDGSLKVSGLHVGLLSDAAAFADLASVAVGPNSPVDSTPPGAPSALEAEPGSEFVALNWNAPAIPGGTPIIGYNLYRGTATGGQSTTPINGSTLIPGLGYTDTGLTNGTTYYYIVKAVNAGGESGPSNEASATPSEAACEPPFLDVPSANIFCLDIAFLKAEGITRGVDKHHYAPVTQMSRQMMAGFIYRQVNAGADAPVCTKKPFADVAKDNPFCGEIAWLKAQGITQGYGGNTFDPTAPMTRQAMAAFMYRQSNPGQNDPVCTVAPFADVPVSHTFCGVITWLRDTGIAHGYTSGKFGGPTSIARQTMAAFVHRLIDK